MATTTSGNKVLNWALGALLSIASYVAVLQNSRVQDIEKVRLEEKEQHRITEKLLIIERSKVDSLQGLRINDNFNNYEKLKEILNIKTSKSTIIIKPKK